MGLSGVLVQVVRIRACHARGQGFESPTHRIKSKVMDMFRLYGNLFSEVSHV